MRIGAQTDPNKKLHDEIARCAEDNFDFVEIVLAAPGAALESTDWNAVSTQLAELNLSAACQAPTFLPIANPSPLVRQAALDELRRCIDATARIGARLLSIPWTGWPDYMPEADGYQFARQWLEIVIRHGANQQGTQPDGGQPDGEQPDGGQPDGESQSSGVEIALINSPTNRHQLKHFREIFHRVPNLRFAYDIGNSNVGMPQSLTRDYLFALADRLTLVHISDNDGTAPQYLPFGAPISGGIALGHELRTLRSFRYDGDITLQVQGDRRWLLAAREILRDVWANAE